MIGKIVCELIPDSENKRNSEGAFISLRNGNILYAYSRYGKGDHDHDPADIYGVLSTDNGETFGEPFPILRASSVGAHNLMSISMIRMNNGDIGLFYLRKDNVVTTDGSSYLKKGQANITDKSYSEVTCIPYFIRSSDEGKTWSIPLRCINENAYFTVNNDRIIRLSSGRFIMPTAKLRFDAPYGSHGSIYIYASDDDGYTWNCISEKIDLPLSLWHDTPSFNACSMEPGVVELEDGTIWCFIRTKMDRQYEMLSYDKGETWTTPNPSRFSSSNSPMSVKRLADGKLLAIWNPIARFTDREYKGHYINKSKWARTPYAYAVLSEDGGKFLIAEDFEDDRDRGFCYCAIHEIENGDILLGYCAGDVPNDGDWLNRIRIRKIYKKELLEKYL